MGQELIVIGAGGGSRELIDMLADMNAVRAPGHRWQLLGVLDDAVQPGRDKVAQPCSTLGRVPVIGPLEAIRDYPRAQVVIGIANQRDVSLRQKVFERLGLAETRYATLIHPRAQVSPRAKLGPGCVIYPQVCIGPDVSLGGNSVVYFNSVIHHDCQIGPHSVICAGVCLGGYVTLGSCVYLGAAAAIRDHLRVGDRALVGMGAVVTKDVESGQTVCGVPARPMEQRRAGAGRPAREAGNRRSQPGQSPGPRRPGVGPGCGTRARVKRAASRVN